MIQAPHTQQPNMAGTVGMVGVSFKTTSLEHLEKITLNIKDPSQLTQRLCQEPTIHHACVLSTCNRTEIYGCFEPNTPFFDTVNRALQDVTGNALSNPNQWYAHQGEETARHLLRVACGLDSLVLGETQILGQVKQAFHGKSAQKPEQPIWKALRLSALKAAKRSRAETSIGEGAVSTASAAVQLITRIYSDLKQRHIAIVGAGETARLTAEHFARKGPQSIHIFNRTEAKARQLAQAFGGRGFALSELEARLPQFDVIVTAARVEQPLLTISSLSNAHAQRRGKPLALVDIGLPRNIDAKVRELPDVILNDIDSLRQVVDDNLSLRRRAIPQVETIIEEECTAYRLQQSKAQIGPLIAAIREKVHAIQEQEVEKWQAKLTPEAYQALRQASRAVTNKLLHQPTAALNTMAQQQMQHDHILKTIEQWFGPYNHNE